MRRRLTGTIHTGLGNSEPEIFENIWTNNELFNNATKAFFNDILEVEEAFEEYRGFDFSIALRENGFKIIFGLEPAYKNDEYLCYCFDSNKDAIYVHRGIAKGYYGSDIVIKEVLKYPDTIPDGFKYCIDKHLDTLMNCLERND